MAKPSSIASSHASSTSIMKTSTRGVPVPASPQPRKLKVTKNNNVQGTDKRKRLAANARERKRMHLLNAAYDLLRSRLVDGANKSKYDILVLAKEYITALAERLKTLDQQQQQQNPGCPSVSALAEAQNCGQDRRVESELTDQAHALGGNQDESWGKNQITEQSHNSCAGTQLALSHHPVECLESPQSNISHYESDDCCSSPSLSLADSMTSSCPSYRLSPPEPVRFNKQPNISTMHLKQQVSGDANCPLLLNSPPMSSVHGASITPIPVDWSLPKIYKQLNSQQQTPNHQHHIRNLDHHLTSTNIQYTNVYAAARQYAQALHKNSAQADLRYKSH